MPLSKIRNILAVILLALLPVSCDSPFRGSDLGPEGSTVPQERMVTLSRGVNLSQWFAQGMWEPRKYRDSDFEFIKSLGFKHVRVPFDPIRLFNQREPEVLLEEGRLTMDRALDRMTESGLAVVLEMHPPEWFKRALTVDDNFIEAFCTFWETLARHLSDRNPDLLFLELMNEPSTENPVVWAALQKKLVLSVRKGAPDHTIIATAAAFSDPDDVARLRPLSDGNVIYSFHFYQPHVFTHQRANWGPDTWRHLADLPYPSSPDVVDPVADQIENFSARFLARRYGRERWSRDRIRDTLMPAIDWSRKHQIPLICSEFGVYRNGGVPEADRLVWLEDVRSILEEENIGWTVWDYTANFGVVDRTSTGTPVASPAIQALGLN